ncbi:hypothetical protein [Halococcoides cellulosivorans]|uniref:Uncharacterized protein n=1 Tax=Halococcoides cellulosivorans TaxID=1679096 RepID=A0A2R4X3V1_9EURY|nr:hypothetical protein [Halococcoides cellulosivorans]AWB28474.1 hypothetical protein HARCEL1_12565 [Halococcoides cellulosivorans]
MPDSLDLDDVAALLFDERRYNGDIRPKAFHKILYFAKEELDRECVDETIDTYWYMWGAVVATSDSSLEIREGTDGQRVICETEVSDIDAPRTTIRRARRAISSTLDRYYDRGIEGLTDEMYDEAPYDVQRHFRELDKQLDAAGDSKQLTITLDRNEKRTRETLHRFVQSFPIDDFPQYEDDLHIWYRLMSAELDSEDYDPQTAEMLAKSFWRLYCLELACRADNLSRSEIAEERGVGSVESAKEEIRERLRRREREKARRNSKDTRVAKEAADAFVVPFIDNDLLLH